MVLEKIWDRLLGPLEGEPATYLAAELATPNFLSDARLEYSSHEEATHDLVLEFSEPVRDGNTISHLNFRDESGSVIDQRDLRTGEMGMRFPINPDLPSFDVVAVNEDGSAFATDRVEIVEKCIDEGDNQAQHPDTSELEEVNDD